MLSVMLKNISFNTHIYIIISTQVKPKSRVKCEFHCSSKKETIFVIYCFLLFLTLIKKPNYSFLKTNKYGGQSYNVKS